jgi:excisionase family DNA binding protein
VAEQIKLPEVARRLGVSEKTARRYVKSGALPSMFVGGAYRVSEEDLEGFLQGAKVTPSGGSPKASATSQPSFNWLLEEERRLRLLAPVAPAAIALNALFAPKVDANDFTIEEYEQVGEAFARLGRLMADAVSGEYIHSEEASEAVLAAFNRAGSFHSGGPIYELQYTLQRAYEELVRREEAGVTKLEEFRQRAG